MYLEMTLQADGTRRALGADLMHAYRVTLTDVNDRTLTFPFFTGLGWDRDPNIGDVLSSLALDLSVDDPDTAEELGMSIRRWVEVKEHNDRVRSFFGPSAVTLASVSDMLEAVEGTTVDLDALATASDRAVERGTADGTDAAGWYVQEVVRRDSAVSVLRGIDDGDPMVLDTFPVLDLSGQWADGPSVSSVLADLDLDCLDPDSDVAEEVVDAYRDAFDSAVHVEVERACRAVLDVDPVPVDLDVDVDEPDM